jgi:pimeloyl-ACP methyl ester carboxylesterase
MRASDTTHGLRCRRNGCDKYRGDSKRLAGVARWTEMPKGGHFAAMEQPELLAKDLREFFRPLR